MRTFFSLVCILVHVAVVYSTPKVLQCCEETAKVLCLIQQHTVQQLDAHSLHKHDHYSALTLVSYDTADILDYALFGFAINSVYAYHHNYGMYTTASSGGFEFEKRDQRWNKVKILHVIIEDLVRSNITDKYIVWMDSDLIVLNLELDLLEIAYSHPRADIIVSQDVEPLNGMINTGCMIIRASTWALAFLDEWWNATDRIDGMDQHVFDLVYKRRLNTRTVHNSAEDITVKIAILAPHALNSYIPAQKHQEADHKVLHLAGESSIVRAHIFKLAFAEICRASTSVAQHEIHVINEHSGGVGHGSPPAVVGYRLNVSALAPQLGITRQLLAGVDYAALLTQEVRGVLTSMHGCGGMSALEVDQSADPGDSDVVTSLICDFNTIVKLRAQLRDAMQSRDLAAPATGGSGEATAGSTAAAGDTLMQLHIQGLLWALHAHQAAYQQLKLRQTTTTTLSDFPAVSTASPVSAVSAVNPDNRRYTEATETTPQIPSKQDHLDHLQAIVDAAFEVCVRSGVSPITMHKTLHLVAPVINKILAEFVGPNSLGPALYYKFKYFDLQSGYYKSIFQPEKEYESLRFAHETWMEMSRLGFYGTGNTVADPCKEVAVVLARLAELECGGDLAALHARVPNMRSVGLERVLQSVNYTVTAWLPKTKSLALLRLLVKRHDASDEVSLQQLEQVFTNPALAGVSSKVLHILSRNLAIAHTCAAADGADVFYTQETGANTEQEATMMMRKLAYVASHLCALLSARGEDCAPDVLSQLRSPSVSASVLDGAQEVLRNANAAAEDSKKRVKLKRKRLQRR